MVKRAGKIAQANLPWGLVAFMPFGAESGIITREIFIDKVYDHFYHLRNDDVVVDIGAHVGLFTLRAAKKVRLVVAIEPHPLNYRLLTLNVALNKLENVIPVKLALSHYSGKAKLYVGKGSGTHTLKGKPQQLESGDTIEVKVETLDRLVNELRLDKVSFIKIDVEGAELDVLKGSEKVLRANNELFLAIAAYHYPQEAYEVARYLHACGLRVFSDGIYVYAFKPSIGSHVSLRCYN